MAGWLGFPGGEKPRSLAEESLEFLAKEEAAIRVTYEKAKADKLRLIQSPPTYFTPFQFGLAVQQADEDISALSSSLLHAEHKLAWEKAKRWKLK